MRRPAGRAARQGGRGAAVMQHRAAAQLGMPGQGFDMSYNNAEMFGKRPSEYGGEWDKHGRLPNREKDAKQKGASKTSWRLLNCAGKDKWELQPVPGKGLGVVAVDFIPRGERILHEVPLLSIPEGDDGEIPDTDITRSVSGINDAIDAEAYWALHDHFARRPPGRESDVTLTKEPGDRGFGAALDEGMTLQSVASSSPAERGGLGNFLGWRVVRADGKRVRTAADIQAAVAGVEQVRLGMQAPPEPPVKTAVGVWRTNAHSVGGATALHLQLSRFNHSCTPNVVRGWLPATHLHQRAEYLQGFNESKKFAPAGATTAHVTRDIEPGEELCHCYVDNLQPRAERRAQLEGWFNFQCRCPACSAAAAAGEGRPEGEEDASDARRAELASLRASLCAAPPGAPDAAAIRRIAARADELNDEEFGGDPQLAERLYFFASRAAWNAGDDDLHEECCHVAALRSRLALGSDSAVTRSHMARVIPEPRSYTACAATYITVGKWDKTAFAA